MTTSGSRRWWAAGALALSGVVIGLDGTVLTLALPTLASDLHASTADLQWFVDSYLLVLGALMLPAGMLGDRFGRKRLLIGALSLFAIGSVACAYAGSVGELIAARALLGLAAAFVLPLSLSVLPVLFAEEERQRAIGVVAGSAIASYPLGPLLGGWMLTHFWWGAVFLINVPVIALALLAVTTLMPESRSERRPRFDPLGIASSTTGLVLLTYGVIEAGQHGWGSTGPLAQMGAGLLVLIGFVAWQRRLDRRGGQPLVDLSLFRSTGYIWGTALSTLLSFALIGLLFAAPQYFQAVLGFDALGSGVRLLPMIGGMFVGLGLGDRLSSLVGSKVTVAAGFLVAAAGLGIAALTTVGDGTSRALIWIAIIGMGTGIALPPAMGAALAQLTGERSGVGSALIAAVRQVGATFGAAVLGSALNSTYRQGLDLTGLPAAMGDQVRDSVSAGIAVAERLHSPGLLDTVRGSFVDGLDVLFWITAAIAVVAALLALAFLPGRATRRPQPETPEVRVEQTVG